MKLFWKILVVYFLAWALLTAAVFAVMLLDLRTHLIPRSPISQNLPSAVAVQIAGSHLLLGDEEAFRQLATVWSRGAPPHVFDATGRELLGRTVDPSTLELAWSLAKDERVVVHDRRNIRKLDPAELGEPVQLVVMDCSFISAAKVLPHLPRFMAPQADAVILVKPQFELDPGRVGKGGIVREEADRQEALDRARASAAEHGLAFIDAASSELEGKTGNREWLLWLRWSGGAVMPPLADAPAPES